MLLAGGDAGGGDGDGAGGVMCDLFSFLVASFRTSMTVPICFFWTTVDYYGLIMQILLGLSS